MQTRDFEDIASEMSAGLRASEFLRDRSPASPLIVVAVSKVDNLSSDIIAEGEKWRLMDSVIDSEAMRALRAERNIRFVIPAEKLRLLRGSEGDGSIGVDRRPTHAMSAVIRSVTRTAGRDRTDLYIARYTITDINSGETAWEGEFLLKRAAVGKSYN